MSTLSVIDGTGAPQKMNVDVDASGNLTPYQIIAVDGVPVTLDAPLPTAPGFVTAAAGAAFQVTIGGNAVTAINPGTMLTGGKIINPLGAQPLIVDTVNTPGTVAPGTHGTSEAIPPGGTWTAPGPLTGAVMVNSTDSNHAFTCLIF